MPATNSDRSTTSPRNVEASLHSIREVRRWPKKLGGLVGKLVGVLLVSYSLIVGYLMVNENRLVYPGQKYPIGNWEPSFEHEDVNFDSADGTMLHGWYLTKTGSHRTVLVFHGNAENVATVSERYGIKLLDELNANVFVFDYRGYGKSAGSPFEAGVIQDGQAALQWLEGRSGKPVHEIIFYGSSIGGGVAVAVAQHDSPRMLLLDRTFDTIVEPAAKKYPWIPVRWIMRNRYPSNERIRDCDVPLFISHFSRDDLIPIEGARRLYEAAPNQTKEFMEIPGNDHLAHLPENFWVHLREVVERFERTLSSDTENSTDRRKAK